MCAIASGRLLLGILRVCKQNTNNVNIISPKLYHSIKSIRWSTHLLAFARVYNCALKFNRRRVSLGTSSYLSWRSQVTPRGGGNSSLPIYQLLHTGTEIMLLPTDRCGGLFSRSCPIPTSTRTSFGGWHSYHVYQELEEYCLHTYQSECRDSFEYVLPTEAKS